MTYFFCEQTAKAMMDVRERERETERQRETERERFKNRRAQSSTVICS